MRHNSAMFRSFMVGSKTRPAFAALFLAAVVATFAADDPPPAPLSSTKEQLKQLRKDEAAAKSGAVDQGLRGALPTLTAPTPGQQGIELPKPSTNNDGKAQGT